MFSIASVEGEIGEYKLTRTGKTSLSFSGKYVGGVKTSDNNAASNYSGSVGCWEEYDIYVTETNKLVIQESFYSRWSGAKNKHNCYVFTSTDDIKYWLATSDIGRCREPLQNLLEKNNIDISERI